MLHRLVSHAENLGNFFDGGEMQSGFADAKVAQDKSRRTQALVGRFGCFDPLDGWCWRKRIKSFCFFSFRKRRLLPC